MKIQIVKVNQSRDCRPYYGWDFDPSWKWTASNGTVYQYSKDGKEIVPEPRTEIVHRDCPDPSVCGGCDGWDETHYYDPDTGEEIHPGRRMVTKHFCGAETTTGELKITEATSEELDELVKPVHKGGRLPTQVTILSDDPRIEQNSFTEKMKGEFVVTEIRVISYEDSQSGIARGSFVVVANMEES